MDFDSNTKKSSVLLVSVWRTTLTGWANCSVLGPELFALLPAVSGGLLVRQCWLFSYLGQFTAGKGWVGKWANLLNYLLRTLYSQQHHPMSQNGTSCRDTYRLHKAEFNCFLGGLLQRTQGRVGWFAVSLGSLQLCSGLNWHVHAMFL